MILQFYGILFFLFIFSSSHPLRYTIIIMVLRTQFLPINIYFYRKWWNRKTCIRRRSGRYNNTNECRYIWRKHGTSDTHIMSVWFPIRHGLIPAEPSTFGHFHQLSGLILYVLPKLNKKMSHFLQVFVERTSKKKSPKPNEFSNYNTHARLYTTVLMYSIYI